VFVGAEVREGLAVGTGERVGVSETAQVPVGVGVSVVVGVPVRVIVAVSVEGPTGAAVRVRVRVALPTGVPLVPGVAEGLGVGLRSPLGSSGDVGEGKTPAAMRVPATAVSTCPGA
jgi:hypothetical protein